MFLSYINRVQRAVALSHYIKHKKDGEIDEQQLAFCIKVENLSKESIKVAAFFSGTTEANSAKNVAESKTTIANHFQKSKVSRVRNQLPRYKCRFCPRKFFRADWLHQHEKFVHLNVRNYDCAICLKSYDETIDLLVTFYYCLILFLFGEFLRCADL